MSVDLALVDTNVLVYSLLSSDPRHAASRALVDRAQDESGQLCLTPTVVSEFFSGITNPRQVSTPYTANEALEEIGKFLGLPGMRSLPMPIDVVERWMAFVKTAPVTGAAVFDLQIAATMMGNGVHRIFTYNRSDFEKLAGIEVLTP